MESKERIGLKDTAISAITKLSEGNPGAATVLVQLYKENAKIDPDSALGAISCMLALDSLGIYGTDIYVFYSDICQKNLVHMVAVLRACQLGLFSRDVLKDACHRQDYSGRKMVPVEELYERVKIELPNFNS
jgi:hypothetical protein